MPFVAPSDRLRRVKRDFDSLARGDGAGQRMVLSGIRREARAELKREFASGTGPYGEWQRTKSGEPALLSKKLPQAFRGDLVAGAVAFTGRTQRDLLSALHGGHAFPARRVAAERQFLSFDKRGRLIRASRVLNKKGELRRGVHQTFARAHGVGQRVLPPRPIYPETMTANWLAAIARGAESGMRGWAAKVTR